MNRKQIALVILLAAGSLAVGTAASAQSVAADVHIGPSGRAAVDIGFFSGDLAPYGRWVDRPAYGRVFVPRIRHAHWRPYTLGHWVWTDYGWTWISDEPFGWATYHYGRWAEDSDLGWYWVPGTDWGPSWVSWQEGGDYIGWAALPPAVGFDASVGLQLGGVDLGVAIAPDAYCFVPERRFLDPRISAFIVPPVRNVELFRTTRNFTNYRVVDNRIFNQGIPATRIQQVVGRPVPQLRVADLPANSRQRVRVQGNQVAFFRPAVNSPHGAHHIGMAAADVAAARNGRTSAAGRISSRQARQPMTAQQSRMQQHQARNQQQSRIQQQGRNQQLQARRQAARVQQPVRNQRNQQQQARMQQRQNRPQAQVQRRPPAAQSQVSNQRQNRQMRMQPQARVQQRQARAPQQQARVQQQQRQARAPQPQTHVQQQPRQARAPQPQARVQQQRSQPQQRQQAQARPRQANPRQGNPRPNNNDHRRPPNQAPPA